MKIKLLGTIVAGAAALVGTAQAQISIVDPNFDGAGTAKISSGWSTVPGWNYFNGAATASNSGVENDASPTPNQMDAFMDAADTVAGIYPSQETSYTLTAGQSITMSYYAEYTYGSTGPGGGWSQPMSAPEQQEADLYYVSGGVPVVFASATITWDAGGGGAPWALYSVNGTVPLAANGDLLGVDFKNVSTDPNYYNWSEVTDVSVVPEPTTAALLGFGVLSSVLGLRRRRS
jgi:hypothetical protein